jgi:subtilisin family serine protease
VPYCGVMTEPIAFRPPSAPGFVSGRGRGCARPAGRAGGWRAAVLAFAVAFPGWVSTRAGEFVREPGRAPNVFVAVPVEEGGSALAAAGEVIVRIRDDARRRPADLAARFGEGRLRWLGSRGRGGRPAAVGGGRSLLEGWATLRLPAGADLGVSVEALGRLPEVESVEPNWRVELAVEPGKAPNDMEFGRQWALNNTGQTGGRAGADIRALEAWGVSTGSREVVVAIVDTGIDYFHPDLEPNLWVNPREVAGNGIDDDGNGYIDDVRGFDFVSDDGDPLDDNLHGTHVAGILGAVGNDEQGVAGVAWSVQMMALKAFDEGGGGTLDDTLEAVAYAVANGARVVNASWGLTTRSRALDEIVARAVASGVVFVAAAGNNGSTVRFFPAAVPEAIAVGATDARDGSPGFSNHGPFVDLVAPGESIQSTALNGSWTTLSGTSMAAPHVSGVVALLLSRRPSFGPDDLAMILRSTVDEIVTDRFTGAGRLQAARAVSIDEPLPTARLAVPAQWSGRIDLPGEAGGHRFAGYRLELGAGSRPERWDELAAGGTPTAAGVVLAGFDTARFDDGEYVVRLVVSNGLGQAAVERVPVAIRNIRMSTPQNNDVTRHGGGLEIRGTVYGEGRVFAVEWGLGWRPSVWRTDGVEIEGGGAAPVVEGVLARWDTRLAPPDAFVAFRLTARRGERRVGESFAEMVHLGARLRPGWPRRFDFTDEFPESNWRQFNVADLDGDGRSEIVVVDHGESGGRPPRLLALEADGSVRWSRVLPSGTPEFDAPVIGDVDGDGRAEVFVDTGSQGLVSAFDAEGRPLGGGWPMAPGGTHLGKVVADLDGDGRAELITLSNPPAELEDTRQRRLTVVDRDGVVVRQWSLGWCEDEARVPELLPAVVDLDEDPALELVAVDGCLGVSAFDLERPEGPVWTALTAANLFASPVTGDLDGDGREEVVIGGVSRGAGRPGGVHVFDHRGQPRPGWPALENESFHASAALADLDLDGRLDVVIPNWDTDVVHLFGADGFELRGWPTPRQANASVRGFPVVGDVTGDGWPEVVLASPGHWLSVVLSGATERSGGIRAWAFDGTPIDFQPLAPPDGLAMESSGGGMLRLPSAALTDLDGDGRLDLVAGTLQDSAYSSTPPVTRPKMRSSLYAWSLPVGVGERRGWPMAQGGPGRTGRFQRHRPPNQPPVLLPIPDQTVAQGDAFRVVLLDRYVVDPDGDERRLVWSAQSTGDLGVTIGPRPRRPFRGAPAGLGRTRDRPVRGPGRGRGGGGGFGGRFRSGWVRGAHGGAGPGDDGGGAGAGTRVGGQRHFPGRTTAPGPRCQPSRFGTGGGVGRRAGAVPSGDEFLRDRPLRVHGDRRRWGSGHRGSGSRGGRAGGRAGGGAGPGDPRRGRRWRIGPARQRRRSRRGRTGGGVDRNTGGGGVGGSGSRTAPLPAAARLFRAGEFSVLGS